MDGKPVSGDAMAPNLAGMSKHQLYDIMSQMKTLIEQNQEQAKQILIQNPLLTKGLFQAQIMLGMVQPPQAIPNIQPAPSQLPQQTGQSIQAAPSLPGQTALRDTPIRDQQQTQTAPSIPSSSIPSLNQPLPSHPLQSLQPPRSNLSAQTSPAPLPHSSQGPFMTPASLPSATMSAPLPLQPPMTAISTQLQQPLQAAAAPHQPPPQPPLPQQPRPPSMQGFPHQHYSQMGMSAGFQHQGALQQLQHSQPMFHSGMRPPPSIGHPFSQGQPPLPNQPPSHSMYQGGQHLPSQSDRVSQVPGGPPPPFFPPNQMNSGSQPTGPPPSLTADMEKQLLQQVMSLTPQQISLLPPEQRSQVLQLQQALRQ